MFRDRHDEDAWIDRLPLWVIMGLIAVIIALQIVALPGCWARNGVDFDAHLRPVPDEQPEPQPKPKPHPLRPRK